MVLEIIPVKVWGKRNNYKWLIGDGSGRNLKSYHKGSLMSLRETHTVNWFEG